MITLLHQLKQSVGSTDKWVALDVFPSGQGWQCCNVSSLWRDGYRSLRIPKFLSRRKENSLFFFFLNCMLINTWILRFFMSKAMLKFWCAYCSLGHLLEWCSGSAARRHSLCTRRTFTSQFSDLSYKEIVFASFNGSRTGLFWGLPGIAAASCDVNNRCSENPCPVKRECSVVLLSSCTKMLSVCWKHTNSNLQFKKK